MTKSQEIQILRDAANKLGPDSYCGSWLHCNIGQIEQTIRGDFFPSQNIVQSMNEVKNKTEYAEKLVEEACKRASEIVDDARRESIQIIANAKDSARDIVGSAGRQLSDLYNVLA